MRAEESTRRLFRATHGAAVALAIGATRAAPWLLATLLDLILIAIWSFVRPTEHSSD